MFYGEEYEQNATDQVDKNSIKRLRQVTTLQVREIIGNFINLKL